MANNNVSLKLARAYLAANHNPLIRLAALSAHLRGGEYLGDRDTAYACVALARAYGIQKLDQLLSSGRDARSTGIAVSADRRFAVFVAYCNDGNIQMTLARRGKPTFFIEMVTDKFNEASLHGHGIRTAQQRADDVASAWSPLWWPDSQATLLTILNAIIPRPNVH
jgi:hypothetical protein